MNVLVVKKICPNALDGGIERVINVLVDFFIRMGHCCFILYETGSLSEDSIFQQGIQCKFSSNNASLLQQYINDNHIDVIWNHEFSSDLVCLLFRVKGRAKLITVYHFSPESEFISIDRDLCLISFTVKNVVKKVLSPIYKKYIYNKIKKNHARIYNDSDKLVLLSESYFLSYRRIFNIKKEEGEKLKAINNPLSFSRTLCSNEIRKKKKIVLIVARLDERQKRLSLALDIWSAVEKDCSLKDWKLVIVGHGDDEQRVRRKVQLLKLQNVCFEGKQNPERYYEEASIFMMTSILEGWPMTLMEALQKGVVSIAFNTFTALPDIIADNETGMIVTEQYVDDYICKLIFLMKQKDLREQMAVNALLSSARYTVEEIGNQWLQLFGHIVGAE